VGIVPWTKNGRNAILKPEPSAFAADKIMLFDFIFFGCPLTLAICLAALAIREEDMQFWRPSFSFFAYCAFYLAGGREVLLYLTVGLMIGGGWCAIDGAGAI